MSYINIKTTEVVESDDPNSLVGDWMPFYPKRKVDKEFLLFENDWQYEDDECNSKLEYFVKYINGFYSSIPEEEKHMYEVMYSKYVAEYDTDGISEPVIKIEKVVYETPKDFCNRILFERNAEKERLMRDIQAYTKMLEALNKINS